VSDSSVLKKSFERDGIVMGRNIFDVDTMAQIIKGWEVFYNPNRTTSAFKPQEIAENIPGYLIDIARHPPLVDVIEQLIGPNIALYNFRFVVKDKQFRDGVFLHQDSCYHVGLLNKISAFVALTHVEENGAMTFYKGSHKLGFLGDAGEINKAAYASQFEGVTPHMRVGDVLFMHSSTWHESAYNRTSKDRILADIIYQGTDDPSGRELIRGEWQCDPLPWLRGDNLFVRSRRTRLIELEQQTKRGGND